MANTFIATRKGRETRVYIVAPWERTTLISQDIADGKESELVSRTGDLITLVCVNGAATYGISGFDAESKTYFADLVRSWFDDLPAHVRMGMN